MTDKCYDCDKLPGARRQQICDGTSGLSPFHRAKYLELWLSQGAITEIDCAETERTASDSRPTANRSSVVRSAPCMTCGGAKSTPKKQTAASAFICRIATRAASLKSAAVDFWHDGLTIATQEQQAHRLAVCGACPLNVGGWCDDTRGGCGCNLAMKVKARSAHCPLGKWFVYGDTFQPLETPKRSLIFHLYPKTGAEWNWHWHIDQIRKHARVFNDKIVIGVGVGRETATMEQVQELFYGIPVTHWFRAENNKLAETNTHLSMMNAVQTNDPNAIVFRYHAKGVTKQPGAVEQRWAELLWQVNMDLDSVDDAMKSHLTCGAMRSMEPLVKAKPGAFFFAGSAYWFRAKEAFERDWQHTDKTRWWVEYMPSHLFSREESACLLYDLTESSVIRLDHFEKHIRPEWNAWKLARGIE